MFALKNNTKSNKTYYYCEKAAILISNLEEKMSNNLENVLFNDHQIEYCTFCRVSVVFSEAIRCSECLVAAYCGIEHKVFTTIIINFQILFKNFDSKHHKLLCYQWKKNRITKDGKNKNSTDFSNLPSTSGK